MKSQPVRTNGWLIDYCADYSTEALLPDTDWSYDEDLKLLQQEFRNITDPLRDSEVKLVIERTKVSIHIVTDIFLAINSIDFQRIFYLLITAPVEKHMNNPQVDMWDQLLEQFGTIRAKAEEMYLTKAKSTAFSLHLLADLMSLQPSGAPTWKTRLR